MGTQPAEVEVFDIDAVELDTPSDGIIKPLHQTDNRTLPAPRGADKSGGLASLEINRYALEDGDIRPGGVFEFDIFEGDTACDFCGTETFVGGAVDGRDAVDGREDFGRCAAAGGDRCAPKGGYSKYRGSDR